MVLLRFWLNDLFRRTSIRVCLLLETTVLVFLAVGITKSTTQIETIDLFHLHFPTIFLNDLKAAEVLLLVVFNQSKLWILFIGIIGVAGFLRNNIYRPLVEMFLLRPISRWKLFLIAYTAMTIVFSICIMYLSIGIWCIIGLKTGLWHGGFLAGSMLLFFAYSLSISFFLWLVLWSKNIFFSLAIFYMYCFISTGLEFRSAIFYSLWKNEWYHRLIDGFYYILPQLDGMLADAATMLRHQSVSQAWYSLSAHHYLFSCASGLAYLFIAGFLFTKCDF